MKNDFQSFYQYISKLWQKQTSAEKLQVNFKPLTDIKANFGGIADVEPIFDQEPSTDKNGVLTLSGHYPIKPLLVVFEVNYINEESSWKLVGIDVKLRKAQGK